MKGTSYNKILLPIDLESQAQEALSIGVDMSKRSGASLIILHAYRLIMNRHHESMDKRTDLKKCLENQAKELFQPLERDTLAKSLVPYKFYSQVGFLTDRIVATAKSQSVDVVVLHESVAQSIDEPKGTGFNRLKDKLDCPIILA